MGFKDQNLALRWVQENIKKVRAASKSYICFYKITLLEIQY